MEAAVTGVWHISYIDLTVRISAALLLGGLIGLEREWSNHSAGFRTHILVCVGSATIMLLSIYGFGEFAHEVNVRMDPARLAAQVITGIGFLGAGAILRKGDRVAGLTTAASIWVVAAIGLSVGAGFYYVAVLATLLVLASLYLLNKWETRMLRDRRKHEVSVKVWDRSGVLGQIVSKFEEQSIDIVNVAIVSDEEQKRYHTLTLRFTFNFSKSEHLLQAIDGIASMPDVLSVDTPLSANKRSSLREFNSTHRKAELHENHLR